MREQRLRLQRNPPIPRGERENGEGDSAKRTRLGCKTCSLPRDVVPSQRAQQRLKWVKLIPHLEKMHLFYISSLY